ncbi:major facilitator superfamily domain-containing protein [Thelonectria olida]|uniref:Major facilitator superfamily domain-containing protein n=1 Tax=Thelonectria olida TaxID=1576542 RepID=A0A9P8VVV3_9HYPO|nr:major facilitator superfamily domain-containing protein [Thelonectria olida]
MATTVSAGHQPVTEVPLHAVADVDKLTAEKRVTEFPEDEKENPENVEEEFKQDGVKQVEAITKVWSKQILIGMFCFLWLIELIESLLQSVQGNLIAYITSSFHKHGLLSSTAIVATIMGGVSRLTIAKIIDIWGRVEGFFSMVLLIVLGMIMKATCKNVETYAAGHTLFWVGHLGLMYIIDIIVADITTLRNRMIIFGINSTPTICTVFAGPKIAQEFYENANFRWAFGAFCIILVAFCIPVGALFVVTARKAKKMGIWPERTRNRTYWESAKYYFFQFDVIGMLLTIAGWSLLLLPFSIATYAPNGWASGYIIAMIVLGVVCLVAFGVWEKWYSPVPYFPFRFLTDRTILGACMLYGLMFCSIYCWDSYYQSYLMVVHNESITISGYVLNSFSLMSSFIGPFVGIALRYFGKYKWPSMAAVPVMVLGTALLVHFRKPDSKVNYLVMCQLFNGLYSGIWALTAQLAVMSSVNHQEVAVGLALWGMFGSIGAAIGYAIAGAIWTNILPAELAKALPDDMKDQAATIFGDITVQLSYPMGSPTRDAIIEAYSVVQHKMVIAGCCFIPVCALCILMWRDTDINKRDEESEQAKGNVF